MCVFTRPVRHVARTRIFARPAADRQVLVYAMEVQLAEDLAMVLPLPVARGAGEDAVRFLDLSAAPDFFAALDAEFPQPQWQGLASRQPRGAVPQPAPLRVHAVGEFVASYVPSAADFGRLDPRFRLAADVVRAIAGAEEAGFAVFQLRAAGGATRRIHPMALDYPRRDPGAVTFPTVHVHDGTVPATAAFDHELYAQGDDASGRADDASFAGWERGQTAALNVQFAPALGIVVPGAVYRRKLTGFHPNTDVVI